MTVPLDDLGGFFRIMTVNGGAHLLAADHRYGFLAACVERPVSVTEIARCCGTCDEPTRLVMEGLAAFGLAEETVAGFHATPVGKLIATTPQILGNRFWNHLPEYLKTGQPIIKMDVLQHQAEHYQAEVGPLGWMLGPAAEEVATLLGIGHRRKGLRILDVGAGSAVWSLAAARRDPSSRVTAVDWPPVLAVAQQHAKRLQLEPQLTVLTGDYHDVPLPLEAFDLAILANITHLETPERNRHVFTRVYHALDADGEAVIIDVFPGSAEGEATRTLYRLGLALRTEHGQVYTQEQLSRQLMDAGFVSCHLTRLQSPPHILGMLVATKSPGPHTESVTHGSV